MYLEKVTSVEGCGNYRTLMDAGNRKPQRDGLQVRLDPGAPMIVIRTHHLSAHVPQVSFILSQAPHTQCSKWHPTTPPLRPPSSAVPM